MKIFQVLKITLCLLPFCLLISCQTAQKKTKTPAEDSKKEIKQTYEPPAEHQQPEQRKSAANIIAEKILANIDKENFNVAVSEFLELKGKSYISSVKGKLISERLVTELVNSKKVTVVERSQLDKVLQELNLSMQGVIDINTAKEVGKILGIDALITGSIINLGGYNEINARMVDTENGKILAAVMTDEVNEVIDVPEVVETKEKFIERKPVRRHPPPPLPPRDSAENIHEIRRKFEHLFEHLFKNHKFKKLAKEAKEEVIRHPGNLIAKLFLGLSLTEIGIKEHNKNILENAAKHLRFVLRNGNHPMLKKRSAIALLFVLYKSGHKKEAKILLKKMLKRAPNIRNLHRVKKIIRELGMK